LYAVLIAVGYWNIALSAIMPRSSWALIEIFGHSEFWLVFFTALLFLATLALWRATARLVRNADANAAKQLRAHISFNFAGIRPTADGAKWIGHVEAVNTGQVVARRIKVRIRVATGPYEPMNFDLPEPEYPVGILQPRQSMILASEDQIPAGTEDRYVYVWGKATYDDDFGSDRWTRFCHRYPSVRIERGQSDGGAPLIEAKYARPHSIGNDAD
jgi:hypothetical protein